MTDRKISPENEKRINLLMAENYRNTAEIDRLWHPGEDGEKRAKYHEEMAETLEKMAAKISA